MSFSIGADRLILGEGDTDVNIVSKNGTDIKINGVDPISSPVMSNKTKLLGVSLKQSTQASCSRVAMATI